MESPLKKAEDLIRLIHVLSTPPARPVQELATSLGRSPRTVYRYLKSLEELGLPLFEEKGRYGLLEAAYLPPLDLDFRETLALYLGAAVAENRLGTLSSELQSAFGKLRKRLSHGEALEDLPRQLLAPASFRSVGSERELEALSTAIIEHREVFFSYRIPGRPEETRRARPQSLFLFEDAWYLWAYDLQRAAHRRFRLSRMREVTISAETFQVGEETASAPIYHRWDNSENEAVEVVIKVTTELAEWLVENPPHPSLKLESNHCKFHVREPASMVPYLLSLEGATVLEPRSLADKVRTRALEIAQAHKRT